MDLMVARVTLKAINNELTKRGHAARLEKASGYFYFVDGEATDWIDRAVERPQVGTLALDQCIDGAARHPNPGPTAVNQGGRRRFESGLPQRLAKFPFAWTA
jgi:hypothetical protein